MHFLAAYRARDNLHRTCAVIAPRSDDDLAHAAASGRKQRRVPREKPLFGQGLQVAARRVEHHFDNALDIAIGGNQPADVHAEPPGDRRADLIGRELLSLDLARSDDVLGQRAKVRLAAQLEPEPLHLSEQAAVFAGHLGEQLPEHPVVPVHGRPPRVFPDIGHIISARFADIMAAILRTTRIISALCAEIKTPNLRIKNRSVC